MGKTNFSVSPVMAKLPYPEFEKWVKNSSFADRVKSVEELYEKLGGKLPTATKQAKSDGAK